MYHQGMTPIFCNGLVGIAVPSQSFNHIKDNIEICSQCNLALFQTPCKTQHAKCFPEGSYLKHKRRTRVCETHVLQKSCLFNSALPASKSTSKNIPQTPMYGFGSMQKRKGSQTGYKEHAHSFNCTESISIKV